jgi:prolyl 4-hydroxylase
LVPRTIATVRDTPPEDPDEPWIEQLSWEPRAWHYHHMLTVDECRQVIEQAVGEVTESLVVGGDGKPTKSGARTSSGVFLGYKHMVASPILRDAERRIAEWAHLPVENGESFYLLQYKVGEKYVPHYDYFGDNHLQVNGGGSGNRYATVLTYLGAPDEGGETVFPMSAVKDLKVKPRIGDAVLFFDMTPFAEGDPKSLHGSDPVIKGVKYAMTKWIRQRKSGNYFGDYLSATDKEKVDRDDRDFFHSNGWLFPGEKYGADGKIIDVNQKVENEEILFP